jgi:lipopolysaccharide biosynthesis regulator YciM
MVQSAIDRFDVRAWQREALVCSRVRIEVLTNITTANVSFVSSIFERTQLLYAAVGRTPTTDVRRLLQAALQQYPSNALLLAVFARSERRARIANRVRRYFDARCRAVWHSIRYVCC